MRDNCFAVARQPVVAAAEQIDDVTVTDTNILCGIGYGVGIAILVGALAWIVIESVLGLIGRAR